MNKSELFSLDRFLSLTGREMVEHVEPFVNVRMEAIPELVYEPLQSKLADMDHQHALYVLEICMLLKPSAFVRCAITFLSDPVVTINATAQAGEDGGGNAPNSGGGVTYENATPQEVRG